TQPILRCHLSASLISSSLKYRRWSRSVKGARFAKGAWIDASGGGAGLPDDGRGAATCQQLRDVAPLVRLLGQPLCLLLRGAGEGDVGGGLERETGAGRVLHEVDLDADGHVAAGCDDARTAGETGRPCERQEL